MAAFYTFEDLSGTSTPTQTDNPYQALIDSCNNDATQISTRYATHRTNRNTQQRAKLLDPSFPGVTPDEILSKLLNPTHYPNFQDPRNCLVFWARPPARIRELIASVQSKLKHAAPNLWTTPPTSLHMTTLEITHSRTPDEISSLVDILSPHAEQIVNYTLAHRAKLVKPLLSYDAQALALSFVPAAEGAYTYHHLRRDVFLMGKEAGVEVGSRYVIPSAHLTIARFVTKGDFEMGEEEEGSVAGGKVGEFIRVIDRVNEWLEREVWDSEKGSWVVGEEKGLEFRKGTLWYGEGGETVCLGQGF